MPTPSHVRLANGASAFLAIAPAAEQGLVILPSMPGTTSAFQQRARDLAADRGWTVCIPEIVTDDPDAGFEERRSVVVNLRDDDVFQVLHDAAAATAAPRVALVGFCIGGMYAMKAASLGLFDRIVAFYGMVRIPTYWQSPHQGEPLDYLSDNTDRLLAIFGEQDEFVPLADIDTIEAAGVPVVRYPDAGHAFAHDPDHPHHRPEDAADAWRRAVVFIEHASVVDR
ncbi:MAG: dienelactone hydrolase family protein [Actinomycetota bacterium]|nr:dienelactone hydrolase family protein [Actinomycetota bacterium]